MNLRSVNIWTTGCTIGGIAAFVALQCGLGVLICGPLCFFPLLGNLILAWMKNRWSQGVLAISSVLYGLGVAYEMYNAFYVNLDPQSGLVLIFVGVAYFPMMIPLWLVALILEAFYAMRTKTDHEPQVKCW